MKQSLAFVALCVLTGALALPAAAKERVVQAKVQARSHHEVTQANPETPTLRDQTLPAATRIAEPQYREPLDAMARAQDDDGVAVDAGSHFPQFPVSPTRGQRFSQEAAAFVSRGLVAAASEKTGVGAPVPSPAYQPYRPGMSVPEPATMEMSCPPLGTPNAPARCNQL